MTTPQRRFTVPRFGLVGIQGIGLDVFGSAFSSFFNNGLSTPSRSSSAPIRRIVPMSPYFSVTETNSAGVTRFASALYESTHRLAAELLKRDQSYTASSSVRAREE